MKNKTPIIYGYARISEREQSNNLEVQASMIRKRAESVEDAVWGKIVGESKSASKLRYWERPKLAGLMKILPGNILIVWRLDRLERAMFDQVAVIKWCVDHDVRLIVLQHGGMELDIQTTAGQIIVCLMAGFAQMQVDQMRITAKEGREWLLENGFATGRPPFGFHNVPLKKLPGQKKPRKITVPIRPEVVDEIVCRIDGGESIYHVAADFSRRNLRCRTRPWVTALPNYHVDPRRIKAAYRFWKTHSGLILPLAGSANGQSKEPT